jgi:hypothetical protein
VQLWLPFGSFGTIYCTIWLPSVLLWLPFGPFGTIWCTVAFLLTLLQGAAGGRMPPFETPIMRLWRATEGRHDAFGLSLVAMRFGFERILCAQL